MHPLELREHFCKNVLMRKFTETTGAGYTGLQALIMITITKLEADFCELLRANTASLYLIAGVCQEKGQITTGNVVRVQ